MAEVPDSNPDEPGTLSELKTCKKYDRVVKRNRSDTFKPNPRNIGAEIKVMTAAHCDVRSHEKATGNRIRAGVRRVFEYLFWIDFQINPSN